MNDLRNDIYRTVERLKITHKTSDPLELAESPGLKVLYKDLGNVKGLYLVIMRCHFILVNENLSDELQTIIIAHEIGHDRLHRHLAEAGQLSEFSLFDMTPTPEREANIFEANVLLEDYDVDELARQEYTTQQIATELCVPEEMLIINMIDMNSRGIGFGYRIFHERTFLGSS